ncbi:uncharacterized protein LOC125559742 [Nematostella vectensis]|uniref:uncharacterized protein LOC125559742 n=1 Tax=Nematostella vectensis TaxID=45351 RepID=UPI002076F222|nr:uncharacterized protein LOC125559742 [Nematostella vectensis]
MMSYSYLRRSENAPRHHARVPLGSLWYKSPAREFCVYNKAEQEASTCEQQQRDPPPTMHSIRKPTGWNAFYQSVAPDVQKQLSDGAGIGNISTVVGRMWKKIACGQKKVLEGQGTKHKRGS